MAGTDNQSDVRRIAPILTDPQGQAALLLVESLIHGLLARSVITVADAVEIVEMAGDVQVEIAKAADGTGEPMWRSHALLTAIAESLRRDDTGTVPLQPVP